MCESDFLGCVRVIALVWWYVGGLCACMCECFCVKALGCFCVRVIALLWWYVSGLCASVCVNAFV